jgi:hypothetical protein
MGHSPLFRRLISIANIFVADQSIINVAKWIEQAQLLDYCFGMGK